MWYPREGENAFFPGGLPNSYDESGTRFRTRHALDKSSDKKDQIKVDRMQGHRVLMGNQEEAAHKNGMDRNDTQSRNLHDSERRSASISKCSTYAEPPSCLAPALNDKSKPLKQVRFTEILPDGFIKRSAPRKQVRFAEPLPQGLDEADRLRCRTVIVRKAKERKLLLAKKNNPPCWLVVWRKVLEVCCFWRDTV